MRHESAQCPPLATARAADDAREAILPTVADSYERLAGRLEERLRIMGKPVHSGTSRPDGRTAGTPILAMITCAV
jgi:hypothetical protein